MKKKILLTFSILWSLFITYNSSLPAEESSKGSGFITNLVFNMIDFVGLNIETDMLEFFIRKLAHFTIFFIFAVLWSLYFTEVKGLNRGTKLVLVLGLLYACFDELLQKSVKGRSGELRDVLIDYSGVMFGLLCYRMTLYIFRKGNKSHVS